jgi:SAM-dependent methyltransferase
MSDENRRKESVTPPAPPARSGAFAQAVEITTATYDRFADDYAARHEDMPPLWAERMMAFVDALAEAEERRPIPELGRPGNDITLMEYLNFTPVLDAGCGPGRDARALAAEGLPVLAVDLSQGMLDAAGERTARRLPKGAIRYALMDMRRLELPDACCRGVWCSASLLHLPRRTAPRAVAELARVARPGAPFAIFLKERPADDMTEHFVPYPSQSADDAARRFFTYYTADEARALVEGAGLLVDDIARAKNSSDPMGAEWLALLGRKGEP